MHLYLTWQMVGQELSQAQGKLLFIWLKYFGDA